MELKCNNCKRLDQSTSVCGYMKEYLPNGYAKLYYGGAIGEYKRNVRYVGKCGSGYQAREESELETIVNVEKETPPLVVKYHRKLTFQQDP